MPAIDLHIHTSATPHHSSWTPDELASTAARRDMIAIAAADHNTTVGVAALQVAGQHYGVRVVSGVELDSSFNGKLWHTLVYNAPPDASELQALCDSVFTSNNVDAQRLMQTLPRAGWLLRGLDDLERQPNVADVATSLARHNNLPGRVVGEDDESAGMRFVLTQVPQGYNPLNVADIVAVAHRLGGIAVLAHPGRSKGIYAIPATEDDIACMAELGLDGIEVYYPSHSVAQHETYLDLAHRYNLLVTGGSDSHHPDQPLASWDAHLCEAFLEHVGILS